jgi:hypothetical protein
MTTDSLHSRRAAKVAEIAGQYAYRRARHIDHTAHTVRRLLLAVSALLERKVTFSDGTTPPGYILPQPEKEPHE